MTQPFSHAFQTIYIMTMVLVQVLYWVSIGYLQKTINGVQSWYALNRKCLKTLTQDVFALVCDVMAGWPPPQSLQKLCMLLQQLCITDLTHSKRRLNEGHSTVCCKKETSKNLQFFVSFFGDFFLLHLLQKKITFLAGVVFEIFALELFCLFFAKMCCEKETCERHC